MPDRVVREQEFFSLLRIQRAAEEWIYESVNDLENLVKDFNASMAGIAPKIVSGNWEILTSYQNEVKTRLLERIEKEARRTETLIGDMKLFNLVGWQADYGVVPKTCVRIRNFAASRGLSQISRWKLGMGLKALKHAEMDSEAIEKSA